MDDDKVMEEEEEEEKERFFSDIVPSDRDRDEDEDEDMDEEEDAGASLAPAASFAGSDDRGATPLAGTTVGTASSGGSTAVEPERRAQIGASPYLTPFTPLSSPNRPKTPSSVSVAQRSGGSKKPQLVPMKNGPSGASFAAGGSSASASKVLKDDVVAHLPNELVDALMSTVQTLDKLILGVEDFKPDQLGFLTDKVNAYVGLLKKVDAAGANYGAMIPMHVLEMLNGEDNTNPELFTKSQLERCQDESERAAGKVATLELLKTELETGLAELQ